jgi:hypothetical protein
VNIRAEAGGRHLGTENIASNRGIIIDTYGRILYAKYQRWYESGDSSVWTDEDGHYHNPIKDMYLGEIQVLNGAGEVYTFKNV